MRTNVVLKNITTSCLFTTSCTLICSYFLFNETTNLIYRGMYTFLLVYLQLFKKPLEIEGVQHFVNARRHKCV